MSSSSPEPPFDVRFLDHTADVGIEVEAPSLQRLLEGAAEGMTRLILGDARPLEEEERIVEAEGSDAALLLRNLLRELLFQHEARGFALARCRIEDLILPESEGEGAGGDGRSQSREPLYRVRCRAVGGGDPGPPDRELKGVTLHGLVAERREGDGGARWFARVIFDV